MAACQRAALTVAQWAAAPSGSMARSGAGPPGVSPITASGWQCAAIQVLLPAALGPSTTTITSAQLSRRDGRPGWPARSAAGRRRAGGCVRGHPDHPHMATRRLHYGPNAPSSAHISAVMTANLQVKDVSAAKAHDHHKVGLEQEDLFGNTVAQSATH